MDVIFRQGDEEAAGVLDAVAGDPPEDAVLPECTFAGGLHDPVTAQRAPEVKQAMVAARGMPAAMSSRSSGMQSMPRSSIAA